MRSEEDAFWLLVGFVAVLGLVLLVGYLLGPIAGVVVFAAGVLAASVWDLVNGEPPSELRDAEQVRHQQGARAGRLVLVVANACPPGDVLARELIRPAEPLPVLEVLAPVLASRTHFVTTDIDHETAEARQGLAHTVARASEHGLTASGHVGDPIDPLAGLADELRRYDVDEVLVALHADDHAPWVESATLDALRNQLRVAVRTVVVQQRNHTPAQPGRVERS